MIYLISALDAEARPLIEYYRLKRDYTLPYTLYTNDTTVLLVTQPGTANAMMATSALLGWRIPSPGDILINIGICAAPLDCTIGEPLLIHQIFYEERRYYPDILYPHDLRESALLCLDSPADTPHGVPVDMESGGVFVAAAKFFKLHQLAFLKIVSDHFEPAAVSKEGAIELIRSQTQTLDHLIASMQRAGAEQPLFSEVQRENIEKLKQHFTAAQGARLEDALCYYRLRHPFEEIPFPASQIPSSKRERSALLEEFFTSLYRKKSS